MDPRHVSALAEAAVRTHLTNFESAYCLLGIVRPDSTFVIVAVVKPDQEATVHLEGSYLVSTVKWGSCPAGTIADLHTHPRGDPLASWIDASSWTRNRTYTLHLIAFVQHNRLDHVGFTAYDFSDMYRPRMLPSGWLTTRED